MRFLIVKSMVFLLEEGASLKKAGWKKVHGQEGRMEEGQQDQGDLRCEEHRPVAVEGSCDGRGHETGERRGH